MKNKITLRKDLLNKRNSLDKDVIKSASLVVTNHLKMHKKYMASHVVAIYYPFGSEISFLDLVNDDKIFLFPKIIDNKMVFIQIDKQTTWEKSSFGVNEPKGEIYLGKIDLMVVPLLGINKDNYRIGYGKGYYDQYLKINNPKHTISYVFDFQSVDFIQEGFDISIDEVISINIKLDNI